MNRRETNIVDVNRATNNEHRLSGLNVGEHDTLNYVEVPQVEQQGDQDVSEYVYSQQLNAYVKRDDFLTNDQGINAVPYFRGTEAPSINYDDVSKLEAHHGGNSAKYYGGKREMPQMF